MNAVFNRQDFRHLPNRDFHNCFGCSPRNSSGLKMEFFTDGSTVVSWLTIPKDLCGWDNLAHGGIISTILDETMSWSAIRLLKCLIMTKSMTVDFLKPVPIGMELTAAGRIREKVSDREALMEAEIYNDSGEVCAMAHGTFALFTLEFIKEKGLASKEQIEFFTSVFSGS